MKPIELILIVKTDTDNNYYTIPIANYEKVLDLIHIKSRM